MAKVDRQGRRPELRAAWVVLAANLLILVIIALAWGRLGPGQALAALLFLDWRIVRGWKGGE